MTQITLTHRIEEYLDLEEMIEQLQAEAETIRDQIKDEMAERCVDEMNVGDYIVKNISITSSRFDTKRFKDEMGTELYKEYTKEVQSKRFTIIH